MSRCLRIIKESTRHNGAPVNTNDEAGTEGAAPILGVQFSAPAILGLFTSGMTVGSLHPCCSPAGQLQKESAKSPSAKSTAADMCAVVLSSVIVTSALHNSGVHEHVRHAPGGRSTGSQPRQDCHERARPRQRQVCLVPVLMEDYLLSIARSVGSTVPPCDMAH